MIINKALLKHGYSKFKLEILEYCNPKEVAKREQYYMNTLSPEYNILKTAYSSLSPRGEGPLSGVLTPRGKSPQGGLGYKHTKESLVKINKTLTKLNKSKSISVKVTNLETNVSHEYISLTDAAKSLNTNKTTLRKYILNSKPLKGIYKLESKLSISNFDSNYLNHPNSIKIEVTDLELNTITSYTSVHSAARALGIGHNSISNYFKRNQTRPYKGRFIFKKV